MAESYPTIITFKPSRYLLHVLHPSLSHSRTFRTHHTCNCASWISTHLLAASALFIPQVNVEIPPHYHTRVPCIPQHAASIHVQMDTFTFSASCCPSCYSLQFSDQGVSSLRGCIGIWVSHPSCDVCLYTILICTRLLTGSIILSPRILIHTAITNGSWNFWKETIQFIVDSSIHSWLISL